MVRERQAVINNEKEERVNEIKKMKKERKRERERERERIENLMKE